MVALEFPSCQPMLRFLRIEHLAVIDAVEVEFEPGLNVLTGETGAGKSMLVEAVGLLMGGRASADLDPHGRVAGAGSGGVRRRRPAGGPGELIVRRDITPQGRSRAFLNDTLVTAAALERCGRAARRAARAARTSDAARSAKSSPHARRVRGPWSPRAPTWVPRSAPGNAAVRAGRVSDGRARKSGAARSAEISDGRNREREASRPARTRSSRRRAAC